MNGNSNLKKMIINMSEFNTDNVHDWSFYSLETFKDMLSSNINLNLGEIESQRLPLKAIMLEVNSQNRIKCIKLGID
ncbi:hypothetical protein EFP68_01405 [Lactobacillus helveticus]|nr:hypothetical protein [Lactobacillus helveticus]